MENDKYFWLLHIYNEFLRRKVLTSPAQKKYDNSGMENFLRIEESSMLQLTMRKLHSHPHYEIYFLYDGKRNFFIENALYSIEAPAVLVVPPFAMHKTEGGAFKRINLYASESLLNDFQKEVLTSLSLSFVPLSAEQSDDLLDVLHLSLDHPLSEEKRHEVDKAKFDYFLLKLYQFAENRLPQAVERQQQASPLVVKAINYMNANYADPLTLDDLAERIYATKQTLNYHFKKDLGCTPMNYLLRLRLTKVKELLVISDKSIEEIAEECGFSSGNYLTLIFKQKESISPTSYRKNRN